MQDEPDDELPPPIEHLLPERSVFYGIRLFADSATRTAECLLWNDLHSHMEIAGAVCRPSFEPEWAVLLLRREWKVRKTHFRDFHLRLSMATSMLYHSKDPATVAVDRRSLPVTPEFAEKIQWVWIAMLLQVRYPTPTESIRIGLDGVRYHFFGGGMSGTTHSPQDGTVTARLVELTHALKDLVSSDEAGRTRILDLIDSQVGWFQARMELPKWADKWLPEP